MNIKLTVFFEDPFWIGVFERTYDGKYDVSRVVFGSEPKDYEIYDFLSENYLKINFSSPINGEEVKEYKVNPKRIQKQVRKEVAKKGTGTKAQEAMRLQIEESKIMRKQVSKARREDLEERKFELKQEKKKEKKKGH